jgi:hypothetical protein
VIEVELGGGVLELASEFAKRLGCRCHVVTAHNPRAQLATAAQNDVADRRLARWSSQRAVEHHRAIGRSADGSWSESGYCIVGLERAAALDLGQRFEQLAIFEVSPERTTVLFCTGGRSFDVWTGGDR